MMTNQHYSYRHTRAIWLLYLVVLLCIPPAVAQSLTPRPVVQVGHVGGVTLLAFSPNGKIVASASSDNKVENTVRLWDVATGKLLRTLIGHTYAVTSLAFSPDGKTLVSTGMYNPDPGQRDVATNVVIFWDTATGEKRHRVTVDRVDAYRGACFSPDGKVVVVGAEYGGIKVYDAVTGEEKKQVDLPKTGFGRQPTAAILAFGADGKTLAVGDYFPNKADIIDIVTGKILSSIPADIQDPRVVTFSRNAETVAFGGADGTIQIFDTATRRKIATLPGHKIAPAPRPTRPGGAGSGIRRPETVTIVFSPDGKRLASCEADNIVRLWDVATGKELTTIPGGTEGALSIAFRPDGKVLGVGYEASTIKFWDCATGKQQSAIKPTVGQMSAVTFSADGNTLAFAVGDFVVRNHTLRFWDLKESQGVRVFVDQAGPVFYLSFSPDGATLTTGNGNLPVTLWNVASGAKLQTIPGRVLTPSWNALSPDGKLLAHSGIDPGLMLNIGEGIEAIQVDAPFTAITVIDLAHKRSLLPASSAEVYVTLGMLKGHEAPVRSVTFRPDSKELASGDAQGVIKLWNLTNGKEVRSMTGHTGAVNSLSYSPDGKTLISASDDGSMTLWDAASGQQLGNLYCTEGTDWTVITPEGRFDTSNLDDIRSIHWVLPDQPFTPIPVEAFFAQYYTPDLLTHLLHRDPLPPLPNIATINIAQPTVNIDKVVAHPGNDPTLVDVTVSYAGQQVESRTATGSTKTVTSGVYNLRLFRNGQLVAALPADAVSGAAPRDLSGGSVGKSATQTFTVRLARDGAKSASFTAYAFNRDKVKSPTATLNYTPPQALASNKGKAWVVAFGANAYEDPRWNLRYAVADARAFGQQLVPRLRETGQYAAVTFIPLISDTGAQNPAELPATKAALRAVLNTLSGKTNPQDAPFTALLRKLGVAKVAPEDTVIMAFSCHGDTDLQTGEYYLFPSDIGRNQAPGLTPALKAHAFSSTELTEWMQDMDAGEMAMVIDSCHSAAVAGQAFKFGPMDSAGLGQLAYYKRMRILSASQADAKAKEYQSLGHGLLTAALLSDGLVAGGAKPAAGQTRLTLGPWLKFAVTDVTALDARERDRKQPSQKGVAGDQSGAGTTDAGLQKPRLFDFHRRDVPDAVIATPRTGQ